MLLQIIAIIWKERKHLPRSRPALYDAALNYLLDYRDREREIEPLLPVEESRCVLAPAALWMQEELEKDEAPKKAMHQTMQPVLDTLAEQPSAAEFCEYLRDRAGLISDYDRDHYVFRHKSFREFLAALQLREDSHQTNRMETLIGHFGDNWWEESLRFFMSKSNDTIFDRFMGLFFQSPVSEQLDAHQQTLLQHLVREAPRKKIDALVEWLNNDTLSAQRRRYVMDCLKTIDTPEAIEAVNKADKSKMDKISRDYAEDIVAEASVEQESLIPVSKTDILETGDSFRNPIEGNVEYIKIPGGTYKYSVTKKMVTVPDLYFCKYPVTNKRYRRFIAYLGGKEKELAQRLPFNRFAEVLLTFAKSIEGYNKYLGNDSVEWQNEFCSRKDDDKRFNGDDQPVVSVTWFAARSYCFWLSCLEAVAKGVKLGNLESVKWLADLYRLPTEQEWEWAAGGEPDGSVREYPWPKEKGEPNTNLTNYGRNVDATTPVGRYPEGATPQGLMDMAGNVWEWMDNFVEGKYPALRGGSWLNSGSLLRCSARSDCSPRYGFNGLGFRVRRGLLPSPKLEL